MEKIIYGGGLDTKMRIFNEYRDGGLSVVCPKCKAEVIVVLDPADIEKHNKAPGTYCPNGHFWSAFNYR